MELYSHLDIALLAIADAVRSLASERVWDVVPAAVGSFWNTDTRVATGVDVAQLVAAALSALFAFVIAIAVLGKKALKPAPVTANAAAGEVASVPGEPGPLAARWGRVTGHLDSAREADWKVAVLEADKFVDDALARAGFPGDSFGDRLTAIAPGTLVSLDGLWWAHRVRNRIAHETDYFLRYTEAKQAVGYFQQALEELKLI